MVELAVNLRLSWLTKLFDLKFGKGFSSVKVLGGFSRAFHNFECYIVVKNLSPI